MTTALYRRYRPETFEDVIGQSHVTEPLMTALRKNKVSHAYLFSGPRGCGKTTSARILARCLNCAQGPIATPCGKCESCRDLARDGAGSLDVIEMDAASHGGVDDARQLRERATFAPVRDRYKIFIIDEAHMVTRDGFNALLKIVEEPPEHIKFIFATTEPSKVLPTIRSRTHHYPFRLVPPEPLMDYLNALCEQEGVGVEPGVQAMVVRAGGGSVRDSLSVLDQLMAGTDGDHLGYDLASSLLGYTHGALLDDVVDAFASGDAATVFRAVDRVIQTGQDPRRFVEDLLERFRDLVIVDAVPDSAGNILHGTPEDQISRLRNQAQLLGTSELSRAADITNEALTEMVGATSPQLHLELLCARLLLPSAENTTRGVAVRVDRLERRLSIGRTGTLTGPLPEAPAAVAQPTAAPQGTDEQPSASHDDERGAPQAAPAEPASSRSRTAAHSPESAHSAQPARETQPVHTAQATNQEAAPRTDDDAAVLSGATTEESPAPTEGGFGKYRNRQPQPPRAAEPSSTSQAMSQGTEREHHPGSPAEAGPQQAGRAPDQTPEQPPHADQSRVQGPASGGEIDMIRNSWTEVVSTLADIHRVSWMTVMRGTPVAFDGSVLQLLFDGQGDRKNFPRFEANLVQAIQQVIGVSCHVEAVGPGSGGQRGAGRPRPGDSGQPTDSGMPGDPGDPHAPGSPGGAGETPAPEGPDSAPSSRERSIGPHEADAPGGGRERTDSAQPSAADGGRATGPRSLPGSGPRPSGPRRPGPRPVPRPTESAKATGDDEFDEPGDFSSWDVAPIPGGASANTAPDSVAVSAIPPDPDGTATLAEPAASHHAEPETPPASTTPAPDAVAAPTEQTTAPSPSAASAAAPEQETAPAPTTPRDAPGLRSATDPQSKPSPPESGRARDQDRPRHQGRSAAPQSRSGDEPSADAPVPPSPYDDIPWSDEPPPEEEAPFEDPGHSRSPRPSGGSVGAGARPTAPELGDSTPVVSGPGDSRPGTSRPVVSESAPARPEPDGPGPSDDDASDPDEAPPEQWRPSAAAAATAPAATRPPGASQGAGGSSTGEASTAAVSSAASPSVGAAAPGRRLSFRERHAAQIAAAQGRPDEDTRGPGAEQEPGTDLDSESSFSPSEDDEAVENSSVGGRAVIERILGARLVEEIPHDPGAL